jgi:hypothetical protein
MQTNTRAFLVWLGPALVVGIAVARVSVWVQPHFSPLVLFPLLIGASLGAILLGLLQLSRLYDVWLAIAGTIVVALVTAAAEHVFFYLDHRSEYVLKALTAGVPEEALTTMSFADYLRQQAALSEMQVMLWIGNAALMVLAATAVVGSYLKARALLPSPLPQGEGNDHS